MARAFEAYGIETSIAEIDPAIHAAAEQYFGVHKPSGQLYLEDARTVLRREDVGVSCVGNATKIRTDWFMLQRFDYIIHDVVRRLS